MKYSQAALDVLTSIQLSSAETLKTISKHLGMKEHAVRYHLQGLLHDGVLKPNTFMNVYPLGLIDHAAFFSLTEASDKVRKLLARDCALRDGICWFAELGGDYQYAIAFKVPNLTEVHQAMQSLSKLLGDVFHERAHATRISQTEFGIRSLSEAKPLAPPYFFGATLNRVEIDKIDHQLLSRLSLYPGENIIQLSKALQIPGSTLRYRIDRFQQAGIAAGFRYLVDPALLGLETFRILISCKGNSAALANQIRDFVAADRSTSHFVECLGSWDYEIQLAVPNFRRVRTFCDSLLDKFGSHIHWLRMIAIFDEQKIVAYPFSKAPSWLVDDSASN